MSIQRSAWPGRSLGILACALFLASCASPGGGGSSGSGGVVASEATAANVARVGFLSDYAKLAPMPGGGGMLCWRDSGVDWKRYDKVLIPELNTGQLRLLIRGNFLIDAQGFNKVAGKPFLVAELVEKINQLLA